MSLPRQNRKTYYGLILGTNNAETGGCIKKSRWDKRVMEHHFIVPGRFRPFHMGHNNLVHFLLQRGTISIPIGWANILSRDNPILAFETRMMILKSIPLQMQPYVEFGQMPFYDFTYDAHGYIGSLSRFLRPDRTNYVVTGNPLVSSLVNSLLDVEVIDALELAPWEGGTTTATLIRSKMLISDNSYEELVPDGALNVLKRLDVSKRISEIERNNIQVTMDAQFPIIVEWPDSSREILYKEDSNEFLDDFVRRVVAEPTPMVTMAHMDRIGGHWEVIPLGIENCLGTYGYRFKIMHRQL
jgi:nicotinamide mononucleotide adenylyltransferase